MSALVMELMPLELAFAMVIEASGMACIGAFQSAITWSVVRFLGFLKPLSFRYAVTVALELPRL